MTGFAPTATLPVGIRLLGVFYLCMALASMVLGGLELQFPGRIPRQVFQLTLLTFFPSGILGISCFLQRSWAWHVMHVTHLVFAICLFVCAIGWFVFEIIEVTHGGKEAQIAIKMLPVGVGIPALLGVLALGAWGYVRKPEVRVAYGVPASAKAA